MLAALRALGVPIERASDASQILRERRDTAWRRVLEPVVVAWEGGSVPLELRLPARLVGRRAGFRLFLESGGEVVWSAETDVPRTAASEDGRRVGVAVPLPVGIPLGAHRLRVEVGAEEGEALVLASPRRAVAVNAPGWGAFLPLHALTSERSWGIGDLTDLEALAGWLGELGGSVVATLPMFAGFPEEASPYSPVSKRFWNEVHLDVTAVPELAASPEARAFVESEATRRELTELRATELVDHARVAALKRRAVEACLGALGEGRREALEAFARSRPELDDYARFRAARERLGRGWRAWPSPQREGRLGAADASPEAVAYHRYAQWLIEEQLAGVATRARDRGTGLALDVPLGVHPDGYDAWRERDSFASGVSVGAPPDEFFRGGQDWGFPPLHPERVREQGYRYPLACLRQAFRHAAVARIDHVLGLHRQWWVPAGEPADRGVYVRSRPEEWYALLALESHRAGTVIVGEDLGTVPPGVRPAMERHGVLRSSVLQMAISPGRSPAVREPSRGSVSSLNTHDMPPFAAFWRDLDRARRAALLRQLRRAGHLSEGSGGPEGAEGSEDEATVLRASLRLLAESEARLVVVGLEDLWGETRPQNVPGLADPANWRRRAARPLEVIRSLPGVVGTLRQVDELRRSVVHGCPAEGDR